MPNFILNPKLESKDKTEKQRCLTNARRFYHFLRFYTTSQEGSENREMKSN